MASSLSGASSRASQGWGNVDLVAAHADRPAGGDEGGAVAEGGVHFWEAAIGAL